MAETQRRYSSRTNRPNKPGKMNKILNVLIALVIVLIVITAGFIFLGNDSSERADSTKNEGTERNTQTKTDSTENDSTDPQESKLNEETKEDPTEGLTTEEVEPNEEEVSEETTESNTEESDSNNDPTATGGSVSSSPSNDPLVSESIVNTSWQPVKTSQTGPHTSVYEKGHIDWDEKVQTLSYATGLASNNMIIWQLSNGGSPQKSIGVVSSNDKQEKYRVYLQWV
ncbi:MAG: YrrS family protein, partial [Melioribacteraceae bacterium]|nr:YrrS family protein [Melioribacteraceae bacterium]